jgi:hypothetical protein
MPTRKFLVTGLASRITPQGTPNSFLAVILLRRLVIYGHMAKVPMAAGEH